LSSLWARISSLTLGDLSSFILTLVSVVGVYIAWQGLTTWKKQIRWEQGRGLAVNLLQSFFVTKQHMFQTLEFGMPSYDENRPLEELVSSLKATEVRVFLHLEELRSDLSDFNKFCAEALIVWDENFEEILSAMRDIEHQVRSALLCGLGAMNPKSKKFERGQSSTTAYMFWSDIRGFEEGVGSMGERLELLQKQLVKKLKARELV
jgi:hypothetical protein